MLFALLEGRDMHIMKRARGPCLNVRVETDFGSILTWVLIATEARLVAPQAEYPDFSALSPLTEEEDSAKDVEVVGGGFGAEIFPPLPEQPVATAVIVSRVCHKSES